MATISNIQCPWKKFYKQVIKCMNSLHIEACEPQMKFDRFMYAMKHNFASPTMNLTKDSKKPTKQLQGSNKSKIIHPTETPTLHIIQNQKATIQNTFQDHHAAYNQQVNIHDHTPTKTSNSSTQSASRRPNLCASPFQTTQRAAAKTNHISTSMHQPKPSTSTSHLSISTCLQKPSTSTWSNTETTIKQPTLPAPKMSTASTYPQCTRKTPLLPTPPASMRNFNYSNHYKQHISRPSAFNNRNPTFTRPLPFYNRFYKTYPTFSGPANYRYYPQPHIPRPTCQHQNFSTRP